MYPIGQLRATSLSIRLLKTLYSFVRVKVSVDLPTCLEPENSTVGDILNAYFEILSSVLLCIINLYFCNMHNYSFIYYENKGLLYIAKKRNEKVLK